MKEIWRNVVGYEGAYKISSCGNVRGFRYKGNFKPADNGFGYLTVCLTKNGKRKTQYVHRLVAEAFIPNPDHLPQVNHIDENKQNNKIENLEWCTAKQNTNHGTAPSRRLAKRNYKLIGDKVSKTKSSGEVLQFDLDGNFIARHQSPARASYAIKGKRNYNINRCLRGEANTAYGFLWRYAEKQV